MAFIGTASVTEICAGVALDTSQLPQALCLLGAACSLETPDEVVELFRNNPVATAVAGGNGCLSEKLAVDITALRNGQLLLDVHDRTKGRANDWLERLIAETFGTRLRCHALRVDMAVEVNGDDKPTYRVDLGQITKLLKVLNVVPTHAEPTGTAVTAWFLDRLSMGASAANIVPKLDFVAPGGLNAELTVVGCRFGHFARGKVVRDCKVVSDTQVIGAVLPARKAGDAKSKPYLRFFVSGDDGMSVDYDAIRALANGIAAVLPS